MRAERHNLLNSLLLATLSETLPTTVTRMTPRRLLHISDLHVCDRDHKDQMVVINALKNDLRTMTDSSPPIDLVLFSGDLVRAASENCDYNLAFDILMDVVAAAGCKEHQVIICPGNHDASQNVVKSNFLDLQNFRSQTLSRNKINALFDDNSFEEYVVSAFKNFDDFCEIFPNSSRLSKNFCFSVHLYQTPKIAVIMANTATLTGAGLAEAPDRGFLCLPEHPLRAALDAVPSGYLKLGTYIPS